MKSHFQSKVFVCLLNNCADAVDRLLIYNCIIYMMLSFYWERADSTGMKG